MKLFKYLVALAFFVVLGIGIYELLPQQPKGEVIVDYDGIDGELNKTSGLKVQVWRNGELFASRGTSVYRSQDFGLTWQKVARLGRIKGGFLRNLRYRVGSLKVVLKLKNIDGIGDVIVLDNGAMIATYGGLFQGKLREGEVVALHNTNNSIDGAPLPQGLTQGAAANVFVGEYPNRPADTPSIIRLHCSPDRGETWNICQEFKRSEIRHIHSVTFDPYRDLLWLTTGDADHESRILYSEDHGRTFATLGEGSQDWRAVSMQFSPDFIYWGTDAPGQWNQILRLNRDTGAREALHTVRNPFYFSTRDTDRGKFYFSTTVEHIEADFPTSNLAEIWAISSQDSEVQRIVSWPKGDLNMWGKIYFAKGDTPPGLLAFTPINLRAHHYETLVLKASE